MAEPKYDLVGSHKKFHENVGLELEKGELLKFTGEQAAKTLEQAELKMYFSVQNIVEAISNIEAIYTLLEKEAENPETRVFAMKKLASLRDYKLLLASVKPYIDHVTAIQEYKPKEKREIYNGKLINIGTIENRIQKMAADP